MSLPVPLGPWVEAMGHADDGVSHEAALGLRFLIEKHVCTGPEHWLADVNAFLALPPELDGFGLAPLRDLALTEDEVDALALEIWKRLLAGRLPAWRYAYVLKQAIGLPVLAGEVADYLETRWQEDEAVTYHLMFGSFEHEVNMRLLPVFDGMAETARDTHLRDLAENRARVTREIAAYRDRS